MAQYVECPENFKVNSFSNIIFLAGGITNCPNWQEIAVRELSLRLPHRDDVAVLNPRRFNFDVTQTGVQQEQIEWEFKNLKRADHLLFWFPNETLCPITLFEYGKWLPYKKRVEGRRSYRCRKIYVGTDPHYQRRQDVVIQTKLEEGDTIKVHDNLKDVLDELIGEIE